jgi:ferredoxin
MGQIPNWSVLPVEECPNCELCEGACNVKRLMAFRPSTKEAWSANSKAAHAGTFTHQVEALLSSMNAPRFFRIHMAGDFFSREYAKQWAKLARKYPGTKFLAFTKAFAQVKGIRWPENFTLVPSAWPGMTAKDLPRNRPIAFSGKPEQYTGVLRQRAERAKECPGGCDQCGSCWGIEGDVRFGLH